MYPFLGQEALATGKAACHIVTHITYSFEIFQYECTETNIILRVNYKKVKLHQLLILGKVDIIFQFTNDSDA